MVIPRHSPAAVFGVLLCLPFLCQCETKRTVKSTRSSISFDPQTWGGQGRSDDKAVRSKFTERGYKVADDGTIKADKPDLYQGQAARGTKTFQTKSARFSKNEAATKEFRTPEYLVRQDFRGVKEARGTGAAAREGNTQDRATGKMFGTKTQGTSDLGSYATSDYRGSGSSYATGLDAASSAAQNAPRPASTAQKIGYQDNVGMTMDDVKRMLNPGSYARNTGLTD